MPEQSYILLNLGEFCRIRSKPSTKNALGICHVQNRQIYRDREIVILWPPDAESADLALERPWCWERLGPEEKGTT